MTCPILFNIYTNDQPLHGTSNFIYADDLCVTAQQPSFKQTEDMIEDARGELTQYYRNNSLHGNPDQTQAIAFHLKNKETKRKLDVTWNGTVLKNTAHPKYLGVTLDRTFSYKKHNTQHEDEGGYPKQPSKEIVYILMGDKCKYKQNHGPGALILGVQPGSGVKQSLQRDY